MNTLQTRIDAVHKPMHGIPLCSSGPLTVSGLQTPQRHVRWQPCPHTRKVSDRALQTAAYNLNRGPEVPDRVIAALPYLLPLLDALPYGRYIFLQYPFVARAMAPLAPLALLYNSIPFAPFILFLAVYSFIVNNQNLSRFIRINAMQAVLLDVLLIIPQVLMDDVVHPPPGGAGLQLYESGTNTIFLFVAVCVAYGMGSCAVGQTPRLPLVAEAANQQIKDGPSGF
eukprot:GHRR01004095.1.p1 GENE.GHRR01004095.1~~GHRR01004095.1.p1  ORF type:complete len:226 (+),score=37.11 GHRR01004095.1:287-964(+)